jgi:hypothetical protein
MFIYEYIRFEERGVSKSDEIQKKERSSFYSLRHVKQSKHPLNPLLNLKKATIRRVGTTFVFIT